MPTSTTRAARRTRSNIPSNALALPLASNTMSAPQPPVMSDTRAARFSLRRVDRRHAVVASDDVELLLHEIGDDDAAAAARQRRQRHHDADRSGADHDGDVARRDPAPWTAACIPIANGSTSAPSAKLTLSGSL